MTVKMREGDIGYIGTDGEFYGIRQPETDEEYAERVEEWKREIAEKFGHLNKTAPTTDEPLVFHKMARAQPEDGYMSLVAGLNDEVVLELEGRTIVGRLQDDRGPAEKITLAPPLVLKDGQLCVDIKILMQMLEEERYGQQDGGRDGKAAENTPVAAENLLRLRSRRKG